MQRGDVVVCVKQGDYGMPRPAVVVQSDLFNPTHDSITVCPISTHIKEASLFRVLLVSSKANGLKTDSQIMVDKITSVRRDKIRQIVGALSKAQLAKLEEAILFWLDVVKVESTV